KKLQERQLSPWVVRSISFRHYLRRVQELTAYYQCLAANPNELRAHMDLYATYWEMSYYDVAVDHLRRGVELLRISPSPEHQKTLSNAESLLATREKELRDVQREFELAAAGKLPKVQAMWAFRPFGLPKQALAALMREDLKTLTPEEVNLVIYL